MKTSINAPDEALTASSRSQPGTMDTIILSGIFAVLLSAPLAFGAVQLWARFAMESSAACLVVIWTFQQIKSGELRVHDNPVFTPMLAFGAVVALQLTFGWTSYAYQTQLHLALYAAYGAFSFLLVQCLRHTRQIKFFAAMFTGYGGAIAMFALLQNLSSGGRLYWLRTPPTGGLIYGPYVNHNHYAGLMEMLLPIAIVTALSHYTRGVQKIAASLAAVLMAVTIFLSGSRGGMVAFAVEVMLLSIILVRHKRNRRNLLVGILALLVVALLVWMIDAGAVSRLASITSETQSELSGGTRLSIDRDSLRMFSHRPIRGWGLGNFPEAYPQFRSFYTDFRINQAHNDYLQLLVETGIPGFAIMLWFLIRIYKNAWLKLEEWPSNINSDLALATILGISGILIHSFVDFNLQIPANAALFYCLCALAAMEPRFSISRRGTN